MTPDQYCQRITARSGSSFYYSFLFLPPDQRRAITAVYAFCREVDDVVDDGGDDAAARERLAWWRAEVNAIFSGAPAHPVARALQPAAETFRLPQEHFGEIIDGMEMDLDRRLYADFGELSLYCYRVASVVGLISARIFGYEDRATLDYARDLGMAFQLTNILRDVREDAARGRIYLPLDEMAAHGVTTGAILAGRSDEGMRALFRQQGQRAHRFYDEALRKLPEVDRFRQRSGLIMAAVYRRLLEEIEAQAYPVLERRVRLPAIGKFWTAWNTARKESARRHRIHKAA